MMVGDMPNVELVSTIPEVAVGGVSGAASQKNRTSGGFRPGGQDVAKIVNGDQFQSASGHCGGHIVDGMRSLTVNLDFCTGWIGDLETCGLGPRQRVVRGAHRH